MRRDAFSGHLLDECGLHLPTCVKRGRFAGRWHYDFAVAAHKLADDGGLPVPAWRLKPDYFPDEPFYAFGEGYASLFSQLAEAGTARNAATAAFVTDMNADGEVNALDARTIRVHVHTGSFA